jgi:hypothetical protein
MPQEMHSILLNKKTAKEAWEGIKTMRLGADRVKEVNAQKLLAKFKSIAFKPGEAIDDFAIWITKLVTDLRGLGEESVTDARMVKKFLRVVPSRYSQVAVAIEMFKDLKTLTIEELIGHLWASEERFEPSVEQVTEKAGETFAHGGRVGREDQEPHGVRFIYIWCEGWRWRWTLWEEGEALEAEEQWRWRRARARDDVDGYASTERKVPQVRRIRALGKGVQESTPEGATGSCVPCQC